jgi:AraC-like DNA-binding protein
MQSIEELPVEITDLSTIVPTPHYFVRRQCGLGWSIPERTISDHELVLVEQGHGAVTIDGRQYAAEPGMLYYFSPTLVHALISDDANPLIFYALHFGYAFMHDEVTLRPAPADSRLPIAAVLRPGNYRKLLEAFKRIADPWQRKFPGHAMICRALLEQILWNLAEEVQAQRVSASSQDKIELVISYLTAHPHERPSLSHLAQLVNITPDYLGMLFKQYTGHTLVTYMNRSKVDAAKVLLMEGHLTVRAIAKYLGFTDEFYFSRIFTQYEQMSPSAFRKRFLSAKNV